MAAIAVYVTYAPAGFFVTATQTPVTAASAVLILLLACNWLLGSMKTSRDRLAVERERYARLADSRDVLYRELHHRVSNNIQIISGLLLLQSQGVGDKAAKRALSEASGRISLVARIQRQLHAQGAERAPFNRFARELLTDAVAASGASKLRWPWRSRGARSLCTRTRPRRCRWCCWNASTTSLEHAFGSAAERKAWSRVSMAARGRRATC